MARIQPSPEELVIDLGFYNGKKYGLELLLKEMKLYFYATTFFCIIWNSPGVSFNKTIKELKPCFKINDKYKNYITEENFNSHFECIFEPKKIESQPFTFFVIDIEFHNTDRACPHGYLFYKKGKLGNK